jgi:Ser-tRNA(Ala) deacylase AlaX
VEDNGEAVDHYVDRIAGMSVGDNVQMVVDESWRVLQSTYHSAGHIVAYALKEIRSDCDYFLGRHWPDHAVVNCHANRELSAHDLEAINGHIREIISAELRLRTYSESGNRYVTFGELRPVCCYGTHLNSTGLLRRVEVVRSEFNGSELQVQYVAYRGLSMKGEAK